MHEGGRQETKGRTRTVNRFAILTILAAVVASGQADARLMASRAKCVAECDNATPETCGWITKRGRFRRCRTKLINTCKRFGTNVMCPTPSPTTTTLPIVTTTTTVPFPSASPTTTSTLPVWSAATPPSTSPTTTSTLPVWSATTPRSTSPTTTSTLPVVPYVYRGGWAMHVEEVAGETSDCGYYLGGIQNRWQPTVAVGERSIVVEGVRRQRNVDHVGC